MNGEVIKAVEMTAKTLKVELQLFEARGPSAYESTFAAIADKKINAIVIHDNPIFVRDAHSSRLPRQTSVLHLLASENLPQLVGWRPTE